MQCKICGSSVKEKFRTTILSKYSDIKYFHCNNCAFLQTEEPFWLQEAYLDSILIQDTGILSRNIDLLKIVSVIIYFLFKKDKQYLDYGGGYGIFTRLIRDVGFNFYWDDAYTKNLLARGFEYHDKFGEVELITSFECFEHFVDPISEIDKMLKLSSNILFTTDLLSNPVPLPEQWWYYALEGGQHISFYSKETLKYIAKKYKLNLYSFGTIHLLTKKKISNFVFNNLMKYSRKYLFKYVQKRMNSLTVQDMNKIIKSK